MIVASIYVTAALVWWTVLVVGWLDPSLPTDIASLALTDVNPPELYVDDSARVDHSTPIPPPPPASETEEDYGSELRSTIAAHQIQEYHLYIRLYGTQSLAWFFFAVTINGATAGWLIQSGRTDWVWLLPIVFIFCDLALALGYAIVLPGVYYQYADLVRAGLHHSGAGLPAGTPEQLWSLLALLVSFTYLVLAGCWFYFFFTSRGRTHLKQVASRSSGE